MFLTIRDFFKCQFALNRLYNCGYLSSYLDPFADWMSKKNFRIFY